MSISTLENAGSVRALGAIDDFSDEYQSACVDADQEISDAFGRLTKVPAERITVPAVGWDGTTRIVEVPIRSAIADMLMDRQCEMEVQNVLEQSQCPIVASLRRALARKWSDMHTANIAERRV